MFEQVNENVVSAIPDNEPASKTKATDQTFDEQIRNADENIRVLYENLFNYILSLGDDISESHLKLCSRPTRCWQSTRASCGKASRRVAIKVSKAVRQGLPNSPLPLYFFLTTVKVRLYLLRKSPPFP